MRIYSSLIGVIQEKIKDHGLSQSEYMRLVISRIFFLDDEMFKTYCDENKLPFQVWHGCHTPEVNKSSSKFGEEFDSLREYLNKKYLKTIVDFSETTKISLNVDEEIYEGFKKIADKREMSYPVLLTIGILEDLAIPQIYEAYRSVNDKDWYALMYSS